MSLWRQSILTWMGALVAAGLAFATQVCLARHLSPEIFGKVSNGYAISVLVATFGFQGVGEVILRRGKAISPVSCFRSAMIFIAVALSAATIWIGVSDEGRNSTGLMLAFIPFTLIQGGVIAGMIGFQLRGHRFGIAGWPVGFQAGRLIIVLGIVLVGGSAIAIPIGWAVVMIPMAWLGFQVLYHPRPEGEDRTRGTSSTGHITRSALPFATTRVLEFAEVQLAVILAVAFLGPGAGGLVAVTLTVIQGLLLLPISVFQRLLRARLHEWGETDRPRLIKVALTGTGLMFLAGVIFSLAIRPFSQWIVVQAFGSDFQDAGAFLATTLLILPIWFASITINAALVTPRDAALRTFSQGIGIAMLALVVSFGQSQASLNGILAGLALCQTVLLVSGLVILLTGRRPTSTVR